MRDISWDLVCLLVLWLPPSDWGHFSAYLFVSPAPADGRQAVANSPQPEVQKGGDELLLQPGRWLKSILPFLPWHDFKSAFFSFKISDKLSFFSKKGWWQTCLGLTEFEWSCQSVKCTLAKRTLTPPKNCSIWQATLHQSSTGILLEL